MLTGLKDRLALVKATADAGDKQAKKEYEALKVIIDDLKKSEGSKSNKSVKGTDLETR